MALTDVQSLHLKKQIKESHIVCIVYSHSILFMDGMLVFLFLVQLWQWLPLSNGLAALPSKLNYELLNGQLAFCLSFSAGLH
jgi:hypothetical protein